MPMPSAETNVAVELSLFASRITAICEEMGACLGAAALSPNIRDRLDYSCALFDRDGALLGQATHIPVHLGSMAFAMTDLTAGFDWRPGDVLIVNDPFLGGTHLPDVTMIAPVFLDRELCGFAANRAHHADIGAESPGSMPISRSLEEEGLVIAPSWLYRAGQRQNPLWKRLMAVLKNAQQGAGDLNAQLAAARRGVQQLESLIRTTGMDTFERRCSQLQNYAEQIAVKLLTGLPAARVSFEDLMDDDGQGGVDIPIRVTVTTGRRNIVVDFGGTAGQVAGNINCPLPVTAAAVFYVIRCLLPPELPTCAGALRPIRIQAPPGSLVNARYPAAVAAGNVETSMRIVDVLCGALARVLPGRIPAAGQGTMNNIAMGAAAPRPWDYYETLGGGGGASAAAAGLNARQQHMTNTLNTPVEVLEKHYPLRVERYGLRPHSGGAGQHTGGCGLVREYRFLEPARVTVLSERRRHSPWGLNGAGAGSRGINSLDGRPLPAKCELKVDRGQRLRVETPGGGGWNPSGQSGSQTAVD